VGRRSVISRRISALVKEGPSLWAGVAVILVSLGLYLITLDNGLEPWQLGGGDLITHQYAQAQLRFANAPGYPIYTVLGWMWFQLGRLIFSPFFNPTEILSLFSTIWGLSTLIVLYVLLLELSKRNWLTAGLVTFLYATTFFFWHYSIASEEYTSAVLQTALIILFAFRWERTREDKYILWLALMVGLALANLITVLLALPALLFFIIKGKPGIVRRQRLMGQAALLIFLPLLSYAYVYLRGSQHPEWWGEGEWNSIMAWFVDFMTIRQGRGELSWSIGGWGPEPLTHVFNELTIVGLVAGLLGIALLGARRAGLLYGIILAYVPFIYIDRFGNWFQAVMPLYLIGAVGIGVLADRAWRRFQGWPRALVIAGLVLLIINRVWTNFPPANQRDKPGDTALELGRAVLADQPPRGAIISGTYEENLSLDYLTHVWGERPDLRVVITDDFVELWEAGEENLYLTRDSTSFVLPELAGQPHLSSQGLLLIAVTQTPNEQVPPVDVTLEAAVGESLALVGYDHLPSDAGLHLALYWRATDLMETDYSVSVRASRGRELLFYEDRLVQQDHPHPVWGYYGTSNWVQGEVVRDDYLVPIPDGLEYDGATIVVYKATDEGFQDLGTVWFPLPTGGATSSDMMIISVAGTRAKQWRSGFLLLEAGAKASSRLLSPSCNSSSRQADLEKHLRPPAAVAAAVAAANCTDPMVSSIDPALRFQRVGVNRAHEFL
jgi:hypothetical protein